MILYLFSLFFAVVWCQQVGTNQREVHPPLTTYHCTNSGCSSQQSSIVLDANWRWTHVVDGYTNCYTGNAWDPKQCPDPQTCAKNCAIDGVTYEDTYGITTSGSELRLNFVTKGQYGTNVGSRVYLMAPNSETKYQMFNLLNKEFSVDVDVSQLPCGLNGALYFVEMPEDGGLSFSGNKAGAKYGTGYCDAQCPHDVKWINGEANSKDWKPSPTDPNSGKGHFGTCCHEMDIWEANSISQAYTAHPCNLEGPRRCNGTICGDGSNRYGGICDKDGCDYNPFRNGNTGFYGPGKTIDTNKPFTLITQFIAPGGELTEIKRIWKQDGKVISNPPGSHLPKYASLTDDYCRDAKSLFGDNPDFFAKGAMSNFGKSLRRGHVFVLSLWDDHEAHMLWLDSNYPLDKDPRAPGVARGTCPITSGVPKDVERDHPNAYVKFSNIKFGDIGSTF